MNFPGSKYDLRAQQGAPIVPRGEGNGSSRHRGRGQVAIIFLSFLGYPQFCPFCPHGLLGTWGSLDQGAGFEKHDQQLWPSKSLSQGHQVALARRSLRCGSHMLLEARPFPSPASVLGSTPLGRWSEGESLEADGLFLLPSMLRTLPPATFFRRTQSQERDCRPSHLPLYPAKDNSNLAPSRKPPWITSALHISHGMSGILSIPWFIHHRVLLSRGWELPVVQGEASSTCYSL